MESAFHLQFNAGAVTRRSTDLGRTGDDGRPTIWGDCPHLAQLRIGWLYPERVAERWTANLTVCGIGPIGPIDLPLVFNVEQPVAIDVGPMTATTNANEVVILLCDLPNSPNLFGATYLAIPDRQGLINPIPDWAVAVTVYGDPAVVTATFLDALGAPIGTAWGPQLVARPRPATQIQLAGAGAAVLFHY
jgi:hypothetical protein